MIIKCIHKTLVLPCKSSSNIIVLHTACAESRVVGRGLSSYRVHEEDYKRHGDQVNPCTHIERGAVTYVFYRKLLHRANLLVVDYCTGLQEIHKSHQDFSKKAHDLYSIRLKAVIKANGGSAKYWNKGDGGRGWSSLQLNDNVFELFSDILFFISLGCYNSQHSCIKQKTCLSFYIVCVCVCV